MKLPEQEARHFIALYSAMIGWCSGRLDPKGKVRDVQGFLEVDMQEKAAARDRMLDNSKVIDEFLSENPYNRDPENLALIGAWRNFLRSDLVIERDLKKHTVFLDWIDHPVAYAVLSLTEEIIDLVPSPLPIVVEAVLLPWRGVIVCDGMIRYKTHLGPGIRRRVRDAYMVAKERGIVTRLGPEAKPEPKPKKNPRASKKSARKRSTTRKKATQPGTAFVGKWRIVEMDAFDEDYFEMEGPAYIEVEKARIGRFHFGLISGEMDCQFSTGGAVPLMEFSWDGNDEHHPVIGRGRAVIGDDGRMRGCIYTHHADDTGFVAEKVGAKAGDQPDRRQRASMTSPSATMTPARRCTGRAVDLRAARVCRSIRALPSRYCPADGPQTQPGGTPRPTSISAVASRRGPAMPPQRWPPTITTAATARSSTATSALALCKPCRSTSASSMCARATATLGRH